MTESQLKGDDNKPFPHTMDARVWAKEWLKVISKNPGIPNDEATMIGWFANSIMAGFDEAMRRCKPNQDCK